MWRISTNSIRSIIRNKTNCLCYATEAKTATTVEAIVPPPAIVDVAKPAVQTELPKTEVLEVPKPHTANVCSFDAIPGPQTLKFVSSMWSYIPVMSKEFTAGTLFQTLNFGRLLGNVLSWGGNVKFFQKFFNVYGPVVRLHGPFGGDVVLLSRPEHASIVFQNEGKQPVRACLDSVEKYRLEHRRLRQAGPFVMSGVAWERIHETMDQPLKSSVNQHFNTLNSICDEFVNRTVSIRSLQDEMPKNFKDDILKWSLESMCAVTLNRKFGFLDPTGLSPTSDPGRILDAADGAIEAIRKCEYGFHFWKFLQTPAWRSLVKNCDTLDSILSKYVERAQTSLREKGNLKPTPADFSIVDRLLLNEDVLIEDVMTVLLDMFIIGANATAHSVAFLLFHLAKSPKCQKKLVEEIEKETKKELSPESLKKMVYLQACIKESLRLAPPIPILNRVLAQNAVIHKYFIPKGTYVLIATHLASLREEYFDDAKKFRPERWLTQEVGHLARTLQEFASMPFGHGPRACQAKELAELQIGLVTVKVLKRFAVEYNYGDVPSSNLMLANPTKPLKFTFFDRC